MTLAPGSRLGPFEILALLGAGGMGEVYRARDVSLKRDVAIKVLPPSYSRDHDRLRRFQLEAQSAAALNHPNILSVFHIGQHGDSPYSVSELLEGETLRDRLRRGPMRLREALDVAVAVAHGLAAAHAKGIVHRDLKPENLFLVKDGRAKILDFGLAKLTQFQVTADSPTASILEQTDPGLVMGTVGYMSPEQVRGETVDARSDIFSLGCVLYEMLTGKRAFQKPTSAETMSAILNDDPPALSQIAPTLPPALQRIVRRCLEKNPDQRFQSAEDLAFAMEALSDAGSSATSVIAKTSSRRSWTRVAAAVITVVAASAIAWWKLPPAVPVIEAVTQLTDDGEPKRGELVTDGSRIYFNEGTMGSLKIAQIAVTGGQTAFIPSRLAGPRVRALAPDASALMVWTGGPNDFLGSLWTIPLPAGEPRRLGNIEASSGGFFPDGRIVFSQGSDLYAAERDGSNVGRLFSFSRGIGSPRVSPDGQRIVFTRNSADAPASALVETGLAGSSFHSIVEAGKNEAVCCAQWTPDGKYLLFRRWHPPSSGLPDIWAIRSETGLLPRSRRPVRLTNGPLSYVGATPSRDGKQIFAIGSKRRGELLRYDMKLNQFLPFLSGISAIDITFSRDGKWVTYASYPDHTLWRSRIDGTDRLQLTYPPMQVTYPFISPDGKRVVFGGSDGDIYLIGMDRSPSQRIVDKGSANACWSPDENLLLMTSWNVDRLPGEKNIIELQIYDLRTGKTSVVPSSQGLVGGFWLSQDMLVASTEQSSKFVTFDLRTQKWTDLLSDDLVNWFPSVDLKYLYYTIGGAEPKAMRIRLADHKTETIASLKDLRRVDDWLDIGTQINVAPDGSPLFTRDIGTQEIYALAVKWP